MHLPPDFHFTQQNLQDFVDCPKRFLLAYILRIAWPAVVSEPVTEMERKMESGSRFHKMIQQYFSGVDVSILEAHCDDPEQQIWLKSFLLQNKIEFPPIRFPEYSLTAQYKGFRFLAKYDLLALSPAGPAVILDWKTNQKYPRRSSLESRIQTRLYPFLLIHSNPKLVDGFEADPNSLSMTYWFANFPDQPVTFPYSLPQYETDETFFSSLVNEIALITDEQFQKTEDIRACQFCVYRSLCERGEKAGSLLDLENDVDFNDLSSSFSFEGIEEIPF
jgi:hypothetical protein